MLENDVEINNWTKGRNSGVDCSQPSLFSTFRSLPELNLEAYFIAQLSQCLCITKGKFQTPKRTVKSDDVLRIPQHNQVHLSTQESHILLHLFLIALLIPLRWNRLLMTRLRMKTVQAVM